MSYTREQRAANAAKKAAQAAQAAQQAQGQGQAEPQQVEPQAEGAKPEQQHDGERRIQVRNRPREDALAEMEALALQRTGAPAEEPKTEPEPEPKAAEPAKAQEPQQDKAQPATEPAAQQPEPEPVKMTRQVVDGKEYQVPQSEIDEAGGERAWRKDRAADHRLEEAKRQLAETRQTQAAVAQWLQQNVQKPAPQQTPDQLIKETIDVIRLGSPEEASAAFLKAVQSMIPQVDPAVSENKTIFKINQKAAADKFREEFPEIVTNPLLHKLAATIENERLPQALAGMGITNLADPRIQVFDFNQFYRMIGNEVRGVVARPSQPAAAPAAAAQASGNPSPTADKEARKASIVNLPSAASARAEPPAEEKEPSRAELLNLARKARGQPTV